MSGRARVLFLKGRAKSYDPLVDCLADIVDAKYVATLAAFRKQLPDGDYEAIFCTASFHGGTYRDLLALSQELRLDVPVIVCSEEDGDREWVEALERGAFDLLVAPFQKGAVARAIEEALQSRDAIGNASRDIRRDAGKEVSWEARRMAPRRRHSA